MTKIEASGEEREGAAGHARSTHNAACLENWENRRRVYPTLFGVKPLKTKYAQNSNPTEFARAYTALVRTREISKSSETLECVDTVGGIWLWGVKPQRPEQRKFCPQHRRIGNGAKCGF
jgi:hypothetical protein